MLYSMALALAWVASAITAWALLSIVYDIVLTIGG